MWHSRRVLHLQARWFSIGWHRRRGQPVWKGGAYATQEGAARAAGPSSTPRAGRLGSSCRCGHQLGLPKKKKRHAPRRGRRWPSWASRMALTSGWACVPPQLKAGRPDGEGHSMPQPSRSAEQKSDSSVDAWSACQQEGLPSTLRNNETRRGRTGERLERRVERTEQFASKPPEGGNVARAHTTTLGSARRQWAACPLGRGP